jgi:hypothetical protein
MTKFLQFGFQDSSSLLPAKNVIEKSSFFFTKTISPKIQSSLINSDIKVKLKSGNVAHNASGNAACVFLLQGTL